MTRTVSATELPNTFRHHLKSVEIGEKFVIDVALPILPTATDDTADAEPLPVIYMTDANLMFPMVNNTLRMLQLGDEFPPAILVGIGYTDESKVMDLRTRDLTPTHDRNYAKLASQIGLPVPPDIQSGGAALFLDFLENQVKPLIRNNYPAQTNGDTLLGDSLGGLFALHTLFTRPDSFARYVAGSPSLWWHDCVLFETEAAYAVANKDLDAKLFISIGALEEPADSPAGWAKMVTNMHAMADRLEQRAYPSLCLQRHEFPDETHVSVIPATFSRGLREVFS